jgi:MoaA/NifB/PqqE/SkfB family radical SAM enzyme
MEACLIVTYRCNAKCYMCNTWQHPSKKDEEFTPALVNKIPDSLKFINITGGEPFLREELDEIIKIALTKTKRLVISTNGYFTKKIVKLAEKYGNKIGIRISIEGLPAANDESDAGTLVARSEASALTFSAIWAKGGVLQRSHDFKLIGGIS